MFIIAATDVFVPFPGHSCKGFVGTHLLEKRPVFTLTRCLQVTCQDCLLPPCLTKCHVISLIYFYLLGLYFFLCTCKLQDLLK